MKLLLIFVSLCVVVINSVNGFSVIRNTSGIYCDGFKCPENSANCVISTNTSPDLKKINYLRECRDIQGHVLHKFEDSYDNPNPGTSVNNYISTGGYSNVITSRNGFIGDSNNYDEEEVKKQLANAQKTVDNALKGVQQQQEYLQGLGKRISDDVYKQLKESLIL